MGSESSERTCEATLDAFVSCSDLDCRISPAVGDVRERFAAQLGEIGALGYLSDVGDHIEFSREGLLRVDWLLHEVFLKSLDSNGG